MRTRWSTQPARVYDSRLGRRQQQFRPVAPSDRRFRPRELTFCRKRFWAWYPCDPSFLSSRSAPTDCGQLRARMLSWQLRSNARTCIPTPKFRCPGCERSRTCGPARPCWLGWAWRRWRWTCRWRPGSTAGDCPTAIQKICGLSELFGHGLGVVADRGADRRARSLASLRDSAHSGRGARFGAGGQCCSNCWWRGPGPHHFDSQSRGLDTLHRLVSAAGQC